MISHPLTLGRVVLRLPPGVDNPQGWRWRTDRALSHITLDAGLPPRAILIVRHLPDVAPGALLANGGGQRWRDEAQAWLRGCWRRAARPALEPVSAAADAVWFADEAEWLACLSWDIHQGAAVSRWWWQTWLRQHRYDSVGATLAGLWREHPRWLPQALALMYERHAAGLVTLLLRLSPHEARAIRQQVAQVYHVPLPDDAQPVTAMLLDALPAGVQRTVRVLPAEPVILAALCLAVTQAPAVLQRLREQSGAHSPQTQTPVIPERPTPPAAETAHAAPAETHVPPAPQPDLADVPPPARETPAAPQQALQSPAIPAGAESQPETIESAPPLFGREDALSQTAPPTPAPEQTAPPAPASPLAVESDTGAEVSVDAAPGVVTELGGLWYLVNLLVDLDWLPYGDPALNPWHRLTWLARSLLADPPPDAVWEILAALAGDEPDETALDSWLIQALPTVEAHLRARLEAQETLTEALRDPAMLVINRTHIDVIFRLDQIRLDLRLAGLDRDPGWLPELAHVITLHYE